MKFVDISQYNTVNDLNILLKSTDGIILRLGYRGYGSSGSLVLDKKFNQYIDTVIKSKKPWGVYFIDQAINIEEGIGQAVYINSILKKYDLSNMKLGVWCDSETSNRGRGRGDVISKTCRTDNIIAMLNKLTELGYKNGIYASNSWLNDRLVYTEINGRYIWNASYGANNGGISSVPSRRADIHQYTSRAICNGVVGGVDMSMVLNPSFLDDLSLSILNKPKDNISSNPYEKPKLGEVLSKKKYLINNKEHVKWLQWNLIKSGVLSPTNSKGKSNIDGWYGINTENAVLRLQELKGIKRDGIAGSVTCGLF
jgi:GH25 family lysozyme M1 (1,4-beta-N-acetylmuramidase)